MNSESRNMEDGSEASELEPETDMSQSGGGTQDSLLSRDSESMNPPECADLGKYINSVDTLSNDQKYRLPSHLYPISTTISHSVTSISAPLRSGSRLGPH